MERRREERSSSFLLRCRAAICDAPQEASTAKGGREIMSEGGFPDALSSDEISVAASASHFLGYGAEEGDDDESIPSPPPGDTHSNNAAQGSTESPRRPSRGAVIAHARSRRASRGMNLSRNKENGLGDTMTSGEQSPIPRRRRERRKERDYLKMISISCKETGVTLYEQTWRWKETQEQSSIGKLIQSFYQFSREVDGGDLLFVNFEMPRKAKGTHARASSSAHLNRRGKGASTRSSGDGAMQMMCAQGDQVLVSVFYDIRKPTSTSRFIQPAMQAFIDDCCEAFSSVYGDEIRASKQQLRALQLSGTEEERQDVRKIYAAFENEVEIFLRTHLEVRWDGAEDSKDQGKSFATMTTMHTASLHDSSAIDVSNVIFDGDDASREG